MGPLIASNANGLDGNRRSGLASDRRKLGGFLGVEMQPAGRVGEFSVEIIDVSRVIDELEPGTGNRHACKRVCTY